MFVKAFRRLCFRQRKCYMPLSHPAPQPLGPTAFLIHILGIQARLFFFLTGSSSQTDEKAENERGRGMVGRRPRLQPAVMCCLCAEKTDADLSLSLGPPGHKFVYLNPHARPGISELPRGFRYSVLCGAFRPDCIFYEGAPNYHQMIEGPVPVVVRGPFIIEIFDHGYLRPIFYNLLRVIKIGRIQKVSFHAVMSPEEIVAVGMNKPITQESTNNYHSPVPTLNENQHT